jgi:hypothetical protein
MSTSVAYLPALADGQEPPEEEPPSYYSIIEGERILNDIKADYDATDVLLEGQISDLNPSGGELVWIHARVKTYEGIIWHWEWKWIKVYADVLEDFEYDRIAISLNGTSHLAAGEYDLLVGSPDIGDYDILCSDCEEGEDYPTCDNWVSITLFVEENTPPEASDMEIFYDEVSSLTRNEIQIQGSDEDGHQPMVYNLIISDPLAGSVSIGELVTPVEEGMVLPQLIYYDQTPYYDGTFTITYQLEDGFDHNLFSPTYTISVTVSNDLEEPEEPVIPPTFIANEDILFVYESQDCCSSFQSSMVLANDVLEEGWTNISLTILPAHGFAFFDSSGVLHYKPNSHYVGTDFVEYLVSNSETEQVARAVVSIEVIEVNFVWMQPWRNADVFWLSEGETINRQVFEINNNYMNQVLDVEIVRPSEHGQATLGIDGNMTYTASTTFNGFDWFKYKITYKSGDVQYRFVKLITVPVDNSLAGDDTGVVDEDSVDNLIWVSNNDLFDENIIDIGLLANPFTFNALPPEDVSIEMAPMGEYFIKFSPPRDYNGDYLLSYYVIDEDWNFNFAYVSITILPTEDPILDIDVDPKAVLQGENITFNPFDENGILHRNGSEYESTFILGLEEQESLIDFYLVDDVNFTPPAFGDILGGTDGNITFTPGNDDHGIVTFTYTYKNTYGDIAVGSVEITVLINNDDVIVDLNPENDPNYDDTYFIQQFTDQGLYLLNGILWVSIDDSSVVNKWVDVYKVHGLLADDFSSGTIPEGQIINSYGLFYLSYFGEDEVGNVGQSLDYRKLIINYQPILMLNAFELNENHVPVESIDMTVSGPDFDLEVDYRTEILGEEINLYDYLYLFDHEDFTVEGETVPFWIDESIGTDPQPITLKFIVEAEVETTEFDPFVDGYLLTEDNLWAQMQVPAGEASHIFDLRFFALDTDGGVSDLTDVFSIQVNNHPPVFVDDGDPVPEAYQYGTLYTEVNNAIDLWTGVEWFDFETDLGESSVDQWYSYRPVADDTLAGDEFIDPEDVAFPFDVAGLYEVLYIIEDSHGSQASAHRYIEVNTPPEITLGVLVPIDVEIMPLIYQLGEAQTRTWEDVMIYDPDGDPMTTSFEIVAYYDFVGGEWVQGSATLSEMEAGYFVARYMVEDDPWYSVNDAADGQGHGMAYDEREIIVNAPPEVGVEDDPFVIMKDSIFDPMDYVLATDLEDDHFGRPLDVGYTTNMIAISEEGASPTFDTSVPGIFMVTYHVEDAYGATDEEVVTVYIISETEVSVDPVEVYMDLGGYFPTYYNLEYDFYNPVEVYPDVTTPYDGMFKRTLYAYIDGEPISPFYQFPDYGDYTIDYVATLWMYQESEVMPGLVEPEAGQWVAVSETIASRLVHVNVDSRSDFVYGTDYGVDIFGLEPMVNGYDELPEWYPAPVLTKVYPNGSQPMVRLVSTLLFVDFDGEETYYDFSEVMDVAVTVQGEVYVLIGGDIYHYLTASGALELAYDTNDYIMNLTADEAGRLVYVTGTMDLLADTMDQEFRVVYLDQVEEGQMVWSIVDEKFFVGPLYQITDIAYSQDFSYIIGQGVLAEESMTQFILFKLEVDESEVLDFVVSDMKVLDANYWHDGIATLGDQIYTAKTFVGETEVTDLPAAGGDVFMDTFTYNEGFVFQDSVFIEDFAYVYTGLASTFEAEMTLSPTSANLYIGYNQPPEAGIVNFTATLFPELAFEAIQWEVVSGQTYIQNNGNGEFQAIEANIGSSADAVISATGILKATGETITIEANIGIYRSYEPEEPQEPQEPIYIPPTDTTPLVTVTLDVDAITLDYGETADPEFTSYDFTETVTGTTNKAVTWELDDDTYVTVDENGLVQAREGIPVDTGDITVVLTVRTVVGGATDTATIIFEEQTPLGAIEFYEPYINGYPDGTFRPSNYVTRAEVAAMFARLLHLNTDFPGTQKFADVPEDHWAYAYVQGMLRTGIFIGYVDSNGVRTFKPDAPISRSEIAQVFTNYWDYLDISVDSGGYTFISDVPDTHWASSAINRIFNTGIFTGFPDGTFRPEEPTLREQLVSMVNILIARPANEAEENSFSDVETTHPFYGDIEAASQTFLKPQVPQTE